VAASARVDRSGTGHHAGGIKGQTRTATTTGIIAADNMDATSLRQRLRGVPAPVLDVGLAVALAVAVTIGIRVAPVPGAHRMCSPTRPG